MENKILHGDSLDLLKELDDKSHPPAIDLDEWADMQATIKKIKNKKVFKSLNAKWY